MEELTPAHVKQALEAANLNISIQYFEASTATSQQAADRIGCALGQIVKSLVFIADEQPLVVLASGDQRVDERKLAAHFNVSRKKIKVAKPEQCVAITGFAPGSVPPIGHRTADLPILIEDSLQRFNQLYAAAGAFNAIFPITLKALLHVTGGQLVDLKREAPE